jgi:hypothetical protein
MMRTLSLAWMLSALTLACVSPHGISGIYSDFRSDIQRHAGAPHDDAAIKRQNERAEKVKKLNDEGQLKSAQDYFEAALVLVETDDVDMLKLSEQLAMKSAELGDARARRVAAEAIDKQLVRLGLAQRYGTQYVYEPVLRGWRLYPYDVRTTDAERQAMGVPPLAELIQGEAKLNERGKPKR